jgi:hypothetical protein
MIRSSMRDRKGPPCLSAAQAQRQDQPEMVIVLSNDIVSFQIFDIPASRRYIGSFDPRRRLETVP